MLLSQGRSHLGNNHQFLSLKDHTKTLPQSYQFRKHCWKSSAHSKTFAKPYAKQGTKMNYKSISSRTDWTHWNQFSSWTLWESQQNWKQNNKNTWIYIALVHILQNKNQEQDSSSRFSKLDGGFWASGRFFNNIFIKAAYSGEKKIRDNLQNGWTILERSIFLMLKLLHYPVVRSSDSQVQSHQSSSWSIPHLSVTQAYYFAVLFNAFLQHQQFYHWHPSNPSGSQVIIII